MNQIIDTALSVLLVDDSDFKIDKVLVFFKQVAPRSKITIAKDQISAQNQIQLEKYDLLLLDMQIPNRIGESEAQENGGVLLLEELEIGEGYLHPTRIIVFTQYDRLQAEIREKYPELGAIKYDLTSDHWKETLFRTLNSLSKSKKVNNKIIYCEGENVDYYNLIGIKGFEFWALKDSRAIYYAAKNEKDKYSLRDRDFLTSNEIGILTNPPYFENYFILEYYCFENYLYHPDNISELVEGFNKYKYIEELTKQKNNKIDSIIQDYKLARLCYTDFTDNERKNMDNNPEDEIISSLKSDSFEVFYVFFDMAGKKDKCFKKSFNKEFLVKYNLDKEKLVKTDWFKMKICKVFRKLIIDQST